MFMNALAGVSCERIVMGAQRITGCVGAVSPELRRRMERVVERLNQLGVRPQQACAAAENQLRALLVTRLRLERDRHRLPAIAAEPIERPIFVIGRNGDSQNPRSATGTSMLPDTLCAAGRSLS